MAGITLAQAEEQLAAWLAASVAIAKGQSYSFSAGDQHYALTRANSAEVKTQVEFWNRKVQELTAGRTGSRFRGLSPG
jgi:hypothetical protein